MPSFVIEIYSDGSCHTQYKIGAWAAILLIGNSEIILKGEAQNTTHNRMELMAVIKAIEYADKNYKNTPLTIYIDSQYVSRIPERKVKLKSNHYQTNKKIAIQNVDLVKKLIYQIETHSVEFIKVKAHQKFKKDEHVNYNSAADKLARQIVREAVKLLHQ